MTRYDDDDLFTLKDTAEHLAISLRMVKGLVAKRKLKAALYVRYGDLLTFIHDREVDYGAKDKNGRIARSRVRRKRSR